MNNPPKSVIHINFLAGVLLFDARPIWTALRSAEQSGRVSSQVLEAIHNEFDEMALHLGTRHYLLGLAVEQLKASLQDLYEMVPDQWMPPVNGYQVVNGRDWDRVRDRSLIAVEMFLYEFRAFLELLAKFSFGLLKNIDRAPVRTVHLISGEAITVNTKTGRVKSHDFLRYMCEQLGVPTDWFTFLARHRNFFTHEGAPYCAIEDRLMIPKEYDLLIMRGNIKDFATADPGDYFRVSECYSVVEGISLLSPALQKYVIDTLMT